MKGEPPSPTSTLALSDHKGRGFGLAATTPLAAGITAVAPGDCRGRYTVRACIGAGGMGEVFAAHDPELDRVIEIKVAS